MKITDLISKLEDLKEDYGNLDVYLNDFDGDLIIAQPPMFFIEKHDKNDPFLREVSYDFLKNIKNKDNEK